MIKGVQKTSFVDFEPYSVITVFTGGCNFSCPFCHNPALVRDLAKYPDIPEEEIIDFIKSRRAWLDGICITGGEPLLHGEKIKKFMIKIKENFGPKFLVKLDHNGSNPTLLKDLIDSKLVDYVAMDYKAPLDKYSEVAGVKVDVTKIKKSVDILMNSGVDYEFRSTIMPRLHTREDLVIMAKELKGAKRFFLQNFVNTGDLMNPDFNKEEGFSEHQLLELEAECNKHVPTKIRKI